MIQNLTQLLKQAQKVQGIVSQLQANLAHRRVEATSGGGMVTAAVNGNQELVSLRIDPQLLQQGDQELMEELIVAAVNDALSRAQEVATEEMKRLAGGMALPGLFGEAEEGDG